jgi:ATP-dependent Lhr-like helicase
MVSSIFNSLNPKIIEGLEKLGIKEPTPPQEKIHNLVKEGKNVLLIAPTASGKTEAALLPVFHSYFRSEHPEGIKIIYITPLRALNRDIERRMIFWAEHLGIDIQVRHGDTSQKQRGRQTRKPPSMLITTPETLQAILPTKSMRKHLTTVKWLIIDEIHDLAESKRGSQLTIGMERLEEIAPGFQRIGLSATVGNPYEIAALLGGVKPVEIVEVEVGKTYKYSVEFPYPSDEDYDLADDLATSPKAASRLNRIINLVKQHNKTLIFVQGRGQAESIGYKLKQIEPYIEVHHGSLSREQRHNVEDAFKSGDIKSIVCTSTLQLGIDVGDVDLCIQYLSPRQVSTLIQRVGRAGHTLSQLSEGITIPAYGEDALESLVTSEMARKKNLEPIKIHKQPLDVLCHQITGLAIGNPDGISLMKIHEIISRAHPYKDYSLKDLEEFITFLYHIALIGKEEGKVKKRGKTRKYYYENLGMMNDERRYPFINAITDQVIGTVGDEFWSLRARLGLNVILRGRVWRIIQIDELQGLLYAIPSKDPLGALPGWDGELIPVTREVAENASELRIKIQEAKQNKKLAELSKELESNENSLKEILLESEAQSELGIPIPEPDKLIIEAYDKYLIIHSPHGENFNRTLGAVIDASLSRDELIYSWWNDPYRVLIEAPLTISSYDLEDVVNTIKKITPDDAETLLKEFLEARFPFGYKMKFIAERFGVIPRGKIMGPELIENLYQNYKDTPIYKETLREAYHDKLDLQSLKEVLALIQEEKISILSFRVKQPTILARHILEKYADVEELMLTDSTIKDQLEEMRKNLQSRSVNLVCLNCANWNSKLRIREVEQFPKCKNCGSGLLAMMRYRQDPTAFLSLLKRWKKGEDLYGDDMDVLVHGRKTADMVLSYGKKALEALMVYGVGPVTSYQVLSKMHRKEEDFYKDLLKAKINYMKNRRYWDDQ